MVPSKDIYADKDGKITDDPQQYAIQVAVAGVNLEDRVAKRYGITDSLVSTEEPGAVRPVRGKVVVEEEAEAPEGAVAAEEESASPAEEKSEAEAAKKSAAKTGAKKK